MDKLSQEEMIRTPLKPNVCKRTSFLVQNAKLLDARRDSSLTQEEKAKFLSAPNETKLKQRQNTKSLLEVKAMKECTFKPVTNERAPSGNESKIYKLPRVARTDKDPV